MEYDMDRNKVVAEMFGNACFTISRGEVAGKIVSAKVFMLTDTDEGLREPIDTAIAKEIKRLSRVPEQFRKLKDWQIEMSVSARLAHTMGIIENTKRNESVVNCAIKHAEDSTIVLVGQIEHGEFLASKIPSSKICFSGMGAKNRRETLASFKTGELKCVVATSMLDEGADFPRAGVLIMAVGGASKRLAEQRTGRVLRSFQGKSHGVIYDFEDSFHPVLAAQSKKRVKLYNQLGYQVIMPGESDGLL
jgi:superfamily II DNA or RNA helicase